MSSEVYQSIFVTDPKLGLLIEFSHAPFYCQDLVRYYLRTEFQTILPWHSIKRNAVNYIPEERNVIHLAVLICL